MASSVIVGIKEPVRKIESLPELQKSDSGDLFFHGDGSHDYAHRGDQQPYPQPGAAQGNAIGGVWSHPDVFSMAAAYAFHISENQPFIDGNKRTALAAALQKWGQATFPFAGRRSTGWKVAVPFSAVKAGDAAPAY